MTLSQPILNHITLRCALAGLIPPLALVAAFIAAFALGSVLRNVGIPRTRRFI